MRPLGLAGGREAIKFANSYSRLPELIALSDDMVAEDWLSLLGEEWTCCDNIGQLAAWDADDGEMTLWDTHFADLWDRPELRPLLMNEAERKAFAALPDEFVIWRGCYRANFWGLSWSLDRDTAARFPTLNRYRRDDEQALLVKAKVRKADCLALKLGRDEQEVVTHRSKALRPRRIIGPRVVSISHLP